MHRHYSLTLNFSQSTMLVILVNPSITYHGYFINLPHSHLALDEEKESFCQRLLRFASQRTHCIF